MSLLDTLAKVSNKVAYKTIVEPVRVYIPAELKVPEFYKDNKEEIEDDAFTTEKAIYLSLGSKGPKLKKVRDLFKK